MGWYYGFKPYVSVAQRKAKANREVATLAKKGQAISPVKIEGRAIATTFWGKAWCDNLESYSDFENRLPRGRTYVRNGSVCDLQITAGRVTALVCGSELYRIQIPIKPLPKATWESVKARCAGQIASLVELLQGRLSKGVMEVVTGREGGLFPKPKEIEMKCSCPDWADVCKHVAAALYGVGSRLDERPELLFTLRGVDHLELIARAGEPLVIGGPHPSGGEARATIAADDLGDVFGIELDGASAPSTSPIPPRSSSPSLSASPQRVRLGSTSTGKPAPPGSATVAGRVAQEPARGRVKPKPAPGQVKRSGGAADPDLSTAVPRPGKTATAKRKLPSATASAASSAARRGRRTVKSA